MNVINRSYTILRFCVILEREENRRKDKEKKERKNKRKKERRKADSERDRNILRHG
jgi:hypothetical protein